MLSIRSVFLRHNYTLTAALCFCFLLGSSVVSAQEKTRKEIISASAPTITVATTGERVRFTAPSNVVRLKLEVFAESGEALFEVSSKGNVFDWTLQDGNGQRIADGAFVCVVTVKSLNGKISQRTGTVSLQGGRVTLQKEATQFTTAQQNAVGPIEADASLTILENADVPSVTVVAHDGKDGQVTATTGALTFRTGDVFAGKDQEQMRITEDGRVGVGTDKPEATLDVVGAVRVTEGIKFSDGTTIDAASGKLRVRNATGEETPNVIGTGNLNRLVKWAEDGGSGTLVNAGGAEVSGLTIFGQNASAQVAPLFPSAPSIHMLEVGATGAKSPLTLAGGSGVMEFWKDLGGGTGAPAGAVAFGLAKPGTAAGLDMVFSTYVSGQPWNERMRMTSAGNVGIGTNNPSAKLDVAGNINTSTEYSIGGARVLSTPGITNLFAGWNAGMSHTLSGYNSFFGYRAGEATTVGASNSFYGSNAGKTNTGDDNSFFGNGAGLGNFTGVANSFYGSNAGNQNFTGSGNSFFGTLTGSSNTTESDNTFLGSSSNGASGITNATAVGHKAQVTKSNSLVLGSINNVNFATADTFVGIGLTAPGFRLHVRDSANAGLRVETSSAGGTVASFGSNGDFRVDAAGDEGGRLIVKENGNVGIGLDIGSPPAYKLEVNGSVAGVGPYQDISDLRYKKDIHTLTGALSMVMRLRGVNFDWRRDEFPALNFSEGRQVGFIAQEMATVIPEAVTTDNKGYYRMAYAEVTPVLVEAIKQQQQIIETLKTRTATIEARLAVLETKRRTHHNRRQRKRKTEPSAKG